PAPQAQRQATRWPNSDVLFFGLIFVLFLGGILRAIFGRLIGAGVIGTIVVMAAWLILSSLAIGLIAGVIAFLLTLLNSGRGSSGWSSCGGGFSGGGGGFSSGGGGFSGGGGSTSGGGAGGSW